MTSFKVYDDLRMFIETKKIIMCLTKNNLQKYKDYVFMYI
jgi:hypothetical protein